MISTTISPPAASPPPSLLLAHHSSFRIGGPARHLVSITNLDQLHDAIQYSSSHSLPFHILGRGSNTLFDSRGYDGLMIKMNLVNLDLSHPTSDTLLVRVGAGYPLHLLAQRLSRRGWSGLEFAVGIPGSIGGAIYMNAGAHGQCISNVLIDTSCLDANNGKVKTSRVDPLSFGYRSSPFQSSSTSSSSIIITGATLQLVRNANAPQIAQQYWAHRHATQPWSAATAGSIFTNPPAHPPAGLLLDQLGCKGMRVRHAVVSDLHANFIVNDEQSATSSDVLTLMRLLQERVLQKHDLLLQPELRHVPFDPS